MTAIGVLCARVRVEEKQIIAALTDAGAMAMPVPPASTPMPPCPASAGMAMPGFHLDDGDDAMPELVIDRCQNRHVAGAMLPLLKPGGIAVIDAGLAATGTRLEIAAALTRAGLPRPQTLIGLSQASALEAASRLGYPATLLPQVPGSAATTLLDHDTAEAVIEHRVVLGAHGEAVVLLQAGAPGADQRGRHHVVGGEVIATEGALTGQQARTLAMSAAQALEAASITVDVVMVDDELVIQDVAPVADFRNATLSGATSVGEALADLATTSAQLPLAARQTWERQVHHGVADVPLTA